MWLGQRTRLQKTQGETGHCRAEELNKSGCKLHMLAMPPPDMSYECSRTRSGARCRNHWVKFYIPRCAGGQTGKSQWSFLALMSRNKEERRAVLAEMWVKKCHVQTHIRRSKVGRVGGNINSNEIVQGLGLQSTELQSEVTKKIQELCSDLRTGGSIAWLAGQEADFTSSNLQRAGWGAVRYKDSRYV